MPDDILAQHLLLPEMRLLDLEKSSLGVRLVVEMTSKTEVCPKCARPSPATLAQRSNADPFHSVNSV